MGSLIVIGALFIYRKIKVANFKTCNLNNTSDIFSNLYNRGLFVLFSENDKQHI